MQNAIRHFRQIGLRLAGGRRVRVLQGLLVLGLALLGAGRAAAAENPWTLASRFGPTTITGLTMRLVSDTLVVLDSNKPLTDGPDAGFHAVRIVNTGGTTVEGVRARLDMAGAGFTLAGSPQVQRASQYVGRLSPGDSVTVFWFVGWPRVIGATGTATVTLTDASAASLTRTDNLVVYSSISSGTGGQIFSIGISSSDAVGALISTEVTYEYGNTQVGDHFQLNPAGNRDFNAGCFQLVRAQVMSSFVSALPAGLTNTLYTEATVVQSGSNKRATVKYTYRSLCVGQQTFADPYASQTSGATNYKYSGNYGFRFTTQPYFPPGTNNFTVSKTVPDSTARRNEPVRFDVIVNNPYGLAVVIDSIVDQMPSGAVFDSVDATSDVTVALSSRNPLPGDTGRLVFVGEPDVSYAIPANSAIRLKYWVRLTGPLASYTNRAAAYTNQIQLGNTFASATVRTLPSDLSVAKSLAAPASPTALDTLTYTILTRNATAVSLPVTLTDSLPAGVTFLSASRSATVAGRLITWPAFTLAADTERIDTVRVIALTAGSYINVARINRPVGDDDSTTNRSAVTTAVGGGQANLAVTKARVLPAAPLAGDTLVYTVTATNLGPKPATGVTVTDSIPAGLVYVSASNAPTVTGRQVVWGPFSLAIGASRTDTLRVAAPLDGTYFNVARVAGAEADPDTTNNRFVEASGSTVGPRANLGIAKVRLGSGLVALGDTIAYQLTVTNAGPSAASGIIVADTLPAGLTFKSATRTPTVTGQEVRWAAFTLASGASRVDTIVVTATASGSFSNVAGVRGTEPDPDLGDNRAVHAPAVQVSAVDLTAAKVRVGSGEATVGDTIQWTVSVQNVGLVPATSVVLIDSLPTGYVYVSATGSPTVTGQAVIWGSFTLAPGASRTETIRARTTLPGTFTNVVRASSSQPDGNPGDNRAVDSPPVTVNPLSGLAVSKVRVGDGPFYVGDTITYVVSVQNAGPDAATNVLLVDSLPTGYTFVSATGSPTVAGRRIAWPAFGLAVDSIATRTIRVIGSTAGTWANVVLVTGDQADPNPVDNRFEENPGTAVLPQADLSITKVRLGAGPFLVGDTIAYRIVTSNAGPSAATGVIVLDTLPSGYVYRSATGAPTVTGQIVRWGPFPLAVGATRTDTVVITTAAAGTYANAASVAGDQADRNLPNNRATEAPATVVGPRANLSLTKVRLGAGPFAVGDTLRFVLTSSNAGPSPATGVTVTDVLPAGYAYLGATNTPTVSGQTVTWGPFALAVGATRADTVRVRATTAGTYINSAVIAGLETDPDTTNNRANETPGTTIGSKADLSVLKTRISEGPFYVTDVITYTIRVQNAGPSPATGVQVTDTLPVGYSFVSGSGSPTVTGQVVTWGPYSLASGAVRTDTLRVRATVSGYYRNAVSVAGTEPDPAPDNNRHTETPGTQVDPRAELSVTKTRLGAGPFYAGQPFSYAIQTFNAGPSATAGLIIADTLPVGFSFVSGTGGPSVLGRIVRWGPLSLAAGSFRVDTLVVLPTEAGTFVNVVQVRAPEDDLNPLDNRDTEDAPGTTVLPSADLTMTKTRLGAGPFYVGDTLVYVLRVDNAGPSPATGITVRDTLPSAFTFVASTGSPAISGQVLTYGPFSLAVGAFRSDTLRVRVTTTGTFLNAAVVGGNESDPDPTDNRGTENPGTTVAPLINLVSETSVLAPPAPRVGDQVTLVIRTRNEGPSRATGVLVTDSLPVGTTLVRASGSPAVAGRQLQWGPFVLDSGAVRVDTVVVTADAAGSRTNIARASATEAERNLADNRSTATFPVESNGTDLVINKRRLTPDPLRVGDEALYELSVRNSGPASATGVVMVDSLPAGLALVSATGSPTVSGQVVFWGPFALAAGVTRADTVRVRFLTEGTFVNVAVTSGDQPDPDSTNNRTTDPNPPTVGPRTNLSVQKQVVGPATVKVGQQLTFVITTRNGGPSAAASVTVVDSLPGGMTLVRATGTPTVAGRRIAWGPFALAANASRTDTVVVSVAIAGRFENVALLGTTDGDISGDDNRAVMPVEVEEIAADLSIEKKRIRPTSPLVGDTIFYLLTTRNAGPAVAAEVRVIDSLPVGLRFVRASRGATATGRSVAWPVVSLPVGGVLRDSVIVVAEISGQFSNVAVVSSSQPDPNPGDNRVVENDAARPVADLRISKALERPRQPEVGDTLLFTIRTTNSGPSVIVAGRILDSLPATMQAVRASAGGVIEGRVVRWAPVSLAAGAARVDSVWALATASGSFVNIAVVSPGDGPSGAITDPDPASNRAVLEFVVGNTPKLFLSKQASGSAERGGALTFDLLLRNDGPGLVADSLFLVDTLPAALVYQGASAPGWTTQFTNRIFSARRAGPLAERDSLRIRLFTRVADNAPSQFENSATAGVIPVGADAIERAKAGRGVRPVRASTGVITLVPPDGIQLDITGDRDEVEVLETVTYTTQVVAIRTVPDPTLRLTITLPRGFQVMPGTVRVSGGDQSRVRSTAKDVQLPLNGLLAGTPVTVTYMARAGVEALRGRGITDARLSNPESPRIAQDSVRTLVRAAMGQEEATIVGQVTQACGDHRSGVAGVRLVLQDGREVRTDADGRYSLPGIAARPQVLRVDETSLPAGLRLVMPRQAVAGRDGGAAILVRPMLGELVAADFQLVPVDGATCAAAPAPAAPAVQADTAVTVDSTARRPGLLVSAMVQARAEAYDKADSLGRVDAEVLDLNIKELATWNADSTRRGAVRGALYLEGSMGEGRNVTLRVDTERPHLDRFFNDLRPDELYPLLGDAAASAARAQSRGRVFGEVNYDGASARFGDFIAPMPEAGTVQLGRYPRALSGAMAYTQGTLGTVTGWASRTTSRFIVDEFRADESTGLLQLRRPNAVLWSETVELVTLDRAHPGVVLRTEQLQRFVDYSVEPGTGRLVLRRMVQGYDEAMNPIVIRVSYEVDGDGERGWAYGGSGELRLGESVRAGVFVVRDDDPLQRFQMASAGASYTLGSTVTLGAELAASDLDGLTGVAGRLDLQVATGGLRLTGRYQDVGENFRNPAAGIVSDRREATLLGTYRIDALTTVGGEYYRSALRSGQDTREGAQAWVARKFGDGAEAEVGLRQILASSVVGGANTAATTQDGTTARARLRYTFNGTREAMVTGEAEAGLTEGMPSRGALGFGMRVFDKTRVFVSQEINTGTGGGYDIASASRRDQTVIGFQSEYRPGQQAYSEYRIGRTIDGRTAASVVGLRNTWRFNDQLSFTGLAERQATATGTGYAVGGGAEYRRPDRTDASVRAEYRVTPAGADNFFATAGLIQRAGPWASMLAQTSVGWQPEADLISARSRAGMVFRRGESTTMLVARYEHHYERSQGVLIGQRVERTVHLLSAHGTVPLDNAMRVRGQVATKFVRDAVGQSAAVDAQASLVGLRLTREIGQRLDLGLAARLLGDGKLSNGLTSYGIEAGYEVASGIRAALGYNVRGFRDKDLAPGATTQRGLYFDLILTATEALLGSRP